MGFRINSLYLSDGYKVGHKSMLAPGTTRLYGTWIPRSLKRFAYMRSGSCRMLKFSTNISVPFLIYAVIS